MTGRRFGGAIVFGLFLISLLGFGAQPVSQSSHLQKSEYSADLKELRKLFNADKKKVRLLMLLSPT
jgi:hypothetical protein